MYLAFRIKVMSHLICDFSVTKFLFFKNQVSICLKSVPCLRKLHVDSCDRIDASILEDLKDHPQLEEVYINLNKSKGNEGQVKLSGNWKRLKRLGLMYCGIVDMEMIGKFTNLTFLSLVNCFDVSDELIQGLSRCSELVQTLKYLLLPGCKITDTSGLYLKRFSLIMLDVSSTIISDKFFENLLLLSNGESSRICHSVQHLCLQEVNITMDSLKAIAEFCGNICRLDLNKSPHFKNTSYNEIQKQIFGTRRIIFDKRYFSRDE